ncbi:hypothetical protein ACPPVQ_17290 [Diaminobutyricibacter sp. McL0618]|uniref:hypothetical protein n=1 Tax=Leifsonia sp. McL0618 TaxID=3415677 RepID=UPI003CF0B871
MALRDFERWMEHGTSRFTDPAQVHDGFGALLTLTQRAGLNVLDPSEIEDVVDVLLDVDADEVDMIDLLHDYLHFRVETAPGEAWEHAHQVFEELIVGDDGLPRALVAALEEEALLDPRLRRAALAGLSLVAHVRELLEWVGSGRSVTDSGALRRADIGRAAAWLGLSARGVAKLPTGGEYRDGAIIVAGEAQVQSMWDLPMLTAWWAALSAAGLIEVTRTRVKQGDAAAGWLREDLPPLDEAAALVSVFVAHLLTTWLQPDDDTWSATLARLTLVNAVTALDPDGSAGPVGPFSTMEAMLQPRVERTLLQLNDAGIMSVDAEGRLQVPEPLRGAFARGVTLAMTFTAEVLGDDDAADIDDLDATNVFDDPELREEMKRMGIVHAPGMAAGLLSEIAPLLAEDGIDVENLDIDDLDAVNAALTRATERHNLELFTPVGEQRSLALTVHRLAAEALAEGSVDLARVVIDGIQPEPVGTLPSVAHVIGLGLGALDAWHQDPSYVKTLATMRIPEWDPPAVRAARDILASASRGNAFDELGALLLRHGGKQVLAGTVLAVAGAVIALAAQETLAVPTMAGRLLADG